MCVCVFSQDDSADLVGSVSELGFSQPGDGHCGGEYSANVNPDRKTTVLCKRTSRIQPSVRVLMSVRVGGESVCQCTLRGHLC